MGWNSFCGQIKECAQVELRSPLVSCCRIVSYGGWLCLAGSWQRLLDDSRLGHMPALPCRHEGRDGEAFALAAPVEPLVNELPCKPCVFPGLIGVADFHSNARSGILLREMPQTLAVIGVVRSSMMSPSWFKTQKGVLFVAEIKTDGDE